MTHSAAENAVSARVRDEHPESAPEFDGRPEGASGARVAPPRLRVDQLTDDQLDALYDRLEDWRTAAGASMHLVDELRAERDALAAGVPLACSDERHKVRVFALSVAHKQTVAERDRARRIAVALENELARGAGRHRGAHSATHQRGGPVTPVDELRAAASRLRGARVAGATTATPAVAALLRAREPLANWLEAAAHDADAVRTGADPHGLAVARAINCR